MAPPLMTGDDLGAFYAGPSGSIWRLITYSDQPTATLECVFSPVRGDDLGRGGIVVERDSEGAVELSRGRRLVGGVVGAPIFDGFERLATVPRADEQIARCAYPGCPTAYTSPQPELHGARVRTGEDEGEWEWVFACPSHVRWLEGSGDYLVSRVTPL